jgi:hypothetical protein
VALLGRKTLRGDDSFILRATSASYTCHLPDKKSTLNAENAALRVITNSYALFIFYATSIFG